MLFFFCCCRAMQSICHSNVTTVHDCSSTRGQEIDTPNCIRATVGIVVHTVRPHFREGKFLVRHHAHTHTHRHRCYALRLEFKCARGDTSSPYYNFFLHKKELFFFVCVQIFVNSRKFYMCTYIILSTCALL